MSGWRCRRWECGFHPLKSPTRLTDWACGALQMKFTARRFWGLAPEECILIVFSPRKMAERGKWLHNFFQSSSRDAGSPCSTQQALQGDERRPPHLIG